MGKTLNSFKEREGDGDGEGDGEGSGDAGERGSATLISGKDGDLN